MRCAAAVSSAGTKGGFTSYDPCLSCILRAACVGQACEWASAPGMQPRIQGWEGCRSAGVHASEQPS